jgi:uncharacterized protein DUF4242
MGRSYVVESYLPRLGSVSFDEASARARAAAEELAARGTSIRYLRSLYLPSDDTCFHLFEAGSAAAVDEVSSRASLLHDRIVEAVE